MPTGKRSSNSDGKNGVARLINIGNPDNHGKVAQTPEIVAATRNIDIHWIAMQQDNEELVGVLPG